MQAIHSQRQIHNQKTNLQRRTAAQGSSQKIYKLIMAFHLQQMDSSGALDQM